jgi:hypothetical protein
MILRDSVGLPAFRASSKRRVVAFGDAPHTYAAALYDLVMFCVFIFLVVNAVHR